MLSASLVDFYRLSYHFHRLGYVLCSVSFLILLIMPSLAAFFLRFMI